MSSVIRVPLLMQPKSVMPALLMAVGKGQSSKVPVMRVRIEPVLLCQ